MRAGGETFDFVAVVAATAFDCLLQKRCLHYQNF